MLNYTNFFCFFAQYKVRIGGKDLKNKFGKFILFAITFGSLVLFMIFSKDFFNAILYGVNVNYSYGVGFYVSVVSLVIFVIFFVFFWFMVLKDKKIKYKLFMFVLPITIVYICAIINTMTGIGGINNVNNIVARTSTMPIATNIPVNVIIIFVISIIYLGLIFVSFSIILRPIKKVEVAVVGIARGNIKEEIKIGNSKELKTIERGLNKISGSIKNNKVMFDKLNNEYSKYLPTQFVKQLGKKSVLDMSLGCNIQKEITSVFIDIKNSTKTSFTLSLTENFNFINRYLGLIGPVVRNYGGFVDKYLGDGVLAIFTDADVAIRASNAIINKIKSDSDTLGLIGIEIKIGIHTGQVVMGVIGEKKRLSATVVSNSVNIASYLEKMNKKLGTQVLFTKNTLDRLNQKHKINYRYVGTMPPFEGKMETVSMFELLDTYNRSTIKKLNDSKLYFESAIRSWESGGSKGKEFMKKAIEIAPDDKVAKMYYNKMCKKR